MMEQKKKTFALPPFAKRMEEKNQQPHPRKNSSDQIFRPAANSYSGLTFDASPPPHTHLNPLRSPRYSGIVKQTPSFNPPFYQLALVDDDDAGTVSSLACCSSPKQILPCCSWRAWRKKPAGHYSHNSPSPTSSLPLPPRPPTYSPNYVFSSIEYIPRRLSQRFFLPAPRFRPPITG